MIFFRGQTIFQRSVISAAENAVLLLPGGVAFDCYEHTMPSDSESIYRYLSSGAMSVPTGINGATAFGGVAANVPEPTSGLLFVIGGMLLGLKRKRQV